VELLLYFYHNLLNILYYDIYVILDRIFD